MDAAAFLGRVRDFHHGGWRLVLINASAPKPAASVPEGAVDLIWSFEKEHALEHLRERVLPGDRVPSIQPIYRFAFLYENELQELFGVQVDGMEVDFHGELYRTSTRVPLSARAIKERLEARKRP